MTREEAANRLARAEAEYREAQNHNGSLRANERYRAALAELAIAEMVAKALINEEH